ncbi:MAG: tryptophan synthase subunit alpha [Deltaproteobacteria bacterium]|nr:tryptophan synthase subunit alpha [Deltaproteobacteria bacterium]
MSLTFKQAFDRAAGENRAAFMPFVSGGYPDLARFGELVRELDRVGADVIEVGIPYADPLADGPVIMRASQAALEAGANPRALLEVLEGVSPGLGAALAVMTYYNPVHHLGLGEFARACRAAGAAGVIIPDLPVEEAGDWIRAARDQDLDTVFLVAPTTTPERLPAILQVCRGFVYYVSLAGVTGSKLDLAGGLLAEVARVKQAAGLPVAVGFGVSAPEEAAALARVADGVIVGSALVRELLEAGGEPGPALALAARLRAACVR